MALIGIEINVNDKRPQPDECDGEIESVLADILGSIRAFAEQQESIRRALREMRVDIRELKERLDKHVPHAVSEALDEQTAKADGVQQALDEATGAG